jgi:hypothetical protein
MLAVSLFGRRDRAQTEDRARRADHAVESGARDLVEIVARLAPMCLTSLRSSRGASGSLCRTVQ